MQLAVESPTRGQRSAKPSCQEVGVKELEHYLLAPDEQHVDIRHIALHARGDRHQRLFHTFSQQGRSELWLASAARWDEHERMLLLHERKCQVLCQAIEHMGEKQEMLMAMMERKKIMQREAPEGFQKQTFQETKE